ncbi:uncharacterized protein LOC128729866 [Anopheles nili]|uniref:uncharacterized protein LOC128729866 n=1 Tax=Anopheles nili TaxID=185578 RepID=UPI00237A174C|nr:uncharacterized protein LOC128729866 [Anopheles nili]
MRSLRYLAAVIVLLQCHYANGDFGIAPTISGAANVDQYARQIRDEVNAIVFGDIIVNGPVAAINEAAAALKAVFEKTAAVALPISQALVTLALNDVGPAETLFSDVDTKIDAMAAFISGNAQTLLATVQTKVSVYVRNELNDTLVTLQKSLTKLKNALAVLRNQVIEARNKGATSANVNTYVDSSVVEQVYTGTLDFATDFPAMAYTALESARTINQANLIYQIGINAANGKMLTESWETEMLQDYNKIISSLQQLQVLAERTIPKVGARVALFAQIFNPLTKPLGTLYGEIGTVYGKVTTGTNDNVLNAYKTLVTSAIGYIQDLLKLFFPPIEPVIKLLAEILIQRGPYSDFCYEKFYPHVENYIFLGELTILNCLDVEFSREKILMEAIFEVIYQLNFFLEDTEGYLAICYRLSLFDETLANNCLMEHTDFSATIPCTAMKEYATLLLLLCKEVDSIRYRLWACMSRDSTQFSRDASDLLMRVDQCRASLSSQG